MLKSMSRTDLVAGVVVILVGAFAFVEALNYPIGTIRRMGPGYFPILLSSLMVLFGLAMVFIEARRPEAPTDMEDAPKPKAQMRPLLANMAAFLAFAATIETLGLFISSATAVFIAGLADSRTPLLKAAIIAIIVATLSSLLFVVGLRLQMKVFP